MKKNLLQFLFGESQVDDEIAGIVESIADIDTDGSDDLKVEKKPLTTALSSLGIEATNLENDPQGLSLVFSDGETYRAAHAILNQPDSLHKLAQLGWVYSTQGDVAMANEPSEFRIRFLEIDDVEPQNTKASYSSNDATRLNKVKDIIKKGREFATTAPDFDYDGNPVDHSAPKKGNRSKGVGKAKDGTNPEGSPKGASGSPSTGKSGSAPGKGGLTQPSEGDSPKMARQESSGVHTPEEIAGNADFLEQAGVLHAPGCECDDCKSDPIGISGAASRQSRGRPGALPMGPAAGAYEAKQSKNAKEDDSDDHEHEYGEVEHSRFTGNPHRKCKVPGCKHVSLDMDEAYQPKTGEKCHCKPGIHRDNCPDCEGTGWKVDFKKIRQASKTRDGDDQQAFAEAGHKSGCQCGFCKNKGNIALIRGKGKGSKEAEKIVDSMLEGNPGTPPPVTGRGKDRKFRPAQGMVQSSPEDSVVKDQTKPNRRA